MGIRINALFDHDLSDFRDAAKCLDRLVHATPAALAVRIKGGGRWRTFLAIEAMRRVHSEALRAVAGALGAARIAFHPNSDELNELFWAGRTQAECVQWMREHWGPPQGSVEAVAPDLITRAELYLPAPVWFFEEVDRGASRLL